MVLSPIRLSVILKIEEYCQDFRISEDAFGRLAHGDHKFVKRIRTGLNLTLWRLESAPAFIDGERAADAVARKTTARAA
jgi:hypothetical protein